MLLILQPCACENATPMWHVLAEHHVVWACSAGHVRLCTALQQRSMAAPRPMGLIIKNPSVPVTVTTWQVCAAAVILSANKPAAQAACLPG